MKLRFTPKAADNVAAIADYLRPRNPAAAQRVRAEIYGSLQNLVLYPDVGRKQDVAGVRKLVTPKYLYLIYYTVDSDAQEIAILSVKHPAQEREYSDA